MNIKFVDEPDSELVKRKNLFIDPESDLSNLLSRLQDSIESDGFTIDRSRYRYIRGRLCKFYIELVNEPDLAALTRRANSMKKLSLNLAKLKWEFQGRSFMLKIGKVQEKDIYITVVFVAEEIGDIERERIKDVKDRVVKGGNNNNNNTSSNTSTTSTSTSNTTSTSTNIVDNNIVKDSSSDTTIDKTGDCMDIVNQVDPVTDSPPLTQSTTSRIVNRPQNQIKMMSPTYVPGGSTSSPSTNNNTYTPTPKVQPLPVPLQPLQVSLLPTMKTVPSIPVKQNVPNSNAFPPQPLMRQQSQSIQSAQSIQYQQPTPPQLTKKVSFFKIR